jgi:outer membrane protein assembly factor BamA
VTLHAARRIRVVPPCAICVLLVFSIGVVLVPSGSPAIEELGAEENISDLLPDTFPTGAELRDFSKRRWAILPEVGFGPDTGVLAGAKFTHRDLFGSGATFDAEGTYAINRQQAVALSLGSPHLWNDRLILLLRAKYYLDPQQDFFGLGNNDIGPDPASTQKFQELGGALTIGWRAFRRVAFNFQVGIRHIQIGRGDRMGDTPFTVDAFPDLPGIHGGVVNPIALSLVWNTRDDVLRPTRGWRFILKVIHTDKSLFSDFEYTRYLGDASYLYAFNRRRQIVGLRVNGEYIDAPKDQIPFWELTELGGPDTLRGFFPHRFVGKSRVLLNLEIRSRLAEFDFFSWWHVLLDGVLFGDSGRVFIDNSELRDEFKLGDIVGNIISDFQYSYGGGLRVALSDALVARIDAGFSDEYTGLVYLSFGQTF